LQQGWAKAQTLEYSQAIDHQDIRQQESQLPLLLQTASADVKLQNKGLGYNA